MAEPAKSWEVTRASRAGIIAAASALFLAWLTMKFHMDNANDSETQAYVGGVLWNFQHATTSADATGHYVGLVPYVLWPLTTGLSALTGAYEIRGLAFALVLVAFGLYGLAYLWYRRLGLNELTSLIGMTLLSTSVLFAMLIRGWEIDKLVDPVLFLVAALAAWRRHFVLYVVVAALAAANRETGIFAPLIAVAAFLEGGSAWRSALRQWPVWVATGVCLVEVIWFRSQLPPPHVRPWLDLNADRLVYVAGGLCLLPLLATAWVSKVTQGVRSLYLVLAPAWLAFVLATDRLEQGAVVLAPIALLCVPITLAGLERAMRAAPDPVERGAVRAQTAPSE